MTPLALSAYLAFSARAETWGKRKLEKRLAKGKEDAARLAEREGHASAQRPAGRLIWFHAASVGESLSLLEVMRRLGQHDPGLHFLITTGTVTSAEVLAARLPPNTIHQYVPLDVRGFVRRFLDHWRPDLAVWTESEFWPNLILEAQNRDIPMLLLNARISDQSTKRWQMLGRSAGTLLSVFKAVQVQDDVSAAHLRKLGLPKDRLAVTGTLKEGTPPPPCDEAVLSQLRAHLKGRALWLAASTHPGEEETAAAAHRLAQKNAHELLLVLVPRHPERGAEVAKSLSEKGFRVQSRSDGALPDENCEIYVADTLGEMGLWYRLAPVSLIGGSLAEIGGHNPFEPASLGSAIIHGPHVANFRDIYDRLDAGGAAIAVTTEEELAAAVSALLQPTKSAPMAYAAWELASSGADVTDKAIALILDYLPTEAASG